MFSDDVLGKIYLAPETQNLPIGIVSDIVHTIERILEEEDAIKLQLYSGISDDLSLM